MTSNNAQHIKEIISHEDIKKIMADYGAYPYSENDETIIFPTICHNLNAADASPKLYYYKNSKMFYCFTQCGKSYDIFELVVARERLQGNETFGFFDALYLVMDKIGYSESFFEEDNQSQYKSRKNYYTKKNNKLPYQYYNPDVLNFFTDYLPYEWAKDGLTLTEVKNYGVKYYPSENQMVIPHYDVNGGLVGVRIRAFNEEDIAKGKYRPLKLENTIYSHPLSQFCYGLWRNKEKIATTKKAVVFEAEKSVMLAEQLEYNNTVACCGSNLSRVQVEQLIQCGAKEIVIAFDKEYANTHDKRNEKYYNKLYSIANRYRLYCNMSFIFDFSNILQEKQSPIDKTIEAYTTLLHKRIRL